MKQIYLKFSMLLVCMIAGLSSAWGAEEVAYTLTPATGSNNSYTGNCDITINGITWNVTGNASLTPWRLGGKSITSTDRTIYSKTAIADNITSIVVTNGTASSITVNSFTLTVASDANFENVISTVTGTFKASGTTTFTRPDDADWTGRYYKFTYNLTVSGSSNKFVQFTSAVFNKEKAATGKTETTTTFPSEAYTAYIGETFTAPTATVTGGDNLVPTYSSSAESVATVDASTGAVTLVAPGTTTIKASYAGDDTYDESSASYTLTVGKVYANIQALQAGVQSTSTAMKLTLSNVTVTGVNGSNAYISDGTYGAVIYTANHGLTAGQTISGTLEAACQIYNGAAEITNYSSTGLTITDGTLGDAPVVSIADLTSANQSKYCKLENVAYAATAATFSDGTNTIAYYDGLKTTLSLTDAKNYDVVGIVSYRKTSSVDVLQFFPISVEEKTAAVEAPTLSLATGTYKGSQSVTITDATDGATIYYTLDGTDPTTTDAPIEYTSAISITATTTLTAAAKNGDTWSNPASATYTIVPLYQDIETAKAAMTATSASDAIDCYITLTNAVVTYINGSNYYIEDGTAGMLIYNNSATVSDKLTKAGLVLNGDLKCAGYIYNGLHEYTKNFDFTEVKITEGTEIPCTKLTIAELLEDGAMDMYESMRVKIVDATVSSALASRKATIAQGDNSIQIYEKVKNALASTALTPAVGTVDVIGYPSINNSTNQINVWEVADVALNTVTRTTETGKYGTICLPATALVEGATIWSASLNDTKDEVTLTKVTDDMVAGTPYIYRATADEQTFVCCENTATTPSTVAPLTGVFTSTKLSAGDYVMQTNNKVQKFYLVAEGSEPTLSAYKAYLTIPSSEAKSLNIVKEGEEETAINAINALVNGEAKIYDMNGRQINKLQKGINIVNGVKVLVK